MGGAMWAMLDVSSRAAFVPDSEFLAHRRRRGPGRIEPLGTDRGLHAVGMHAELSARGGEIQMPLPRAWVPAERYQLRRTGARPLERAAILLADDGQILIDKGR